MEQVVLQPQVEHFSLGIVMERFAQEIWMEKLALEV
jgi:hypothetical protein